MAGVERIVWCLAVWTTVVSAGPSIGGSVVRPTVGRVWPQPQRVRWSDVALAVDAETFRFVDRRNEPCEILERAYDRYYVTIFDPPRRPKRRCPPSVADRTDKRVVVDRLHVVLNGTCGTWPPPDMDERYRLDIVPSGRAKLASQSVWGLLRGLETFSQLVYADRCGNWFVNVTGIDDFPRFSFRGVMLDTSRHFLPVRVIQRQLDAMAHSKFNVFHWHIVDDQAFPYQSRRFPNLSAEGAFVPDTHVYAVRDVIGVIEHARLRGIRVIAEYDTPGHTLSWGRGQPGLLTPCYENVSGTPTSYGPIDPTVESNYDFLGGLFAEVARLFPDPYVHLGGDEVPFDCWKSNPNVTAFMKRMGFGDDYRKLESYYFQKVVDAVERLDKSYVVWQEVFDKGVRLDDDAVVHVWKQSPKPATELRNVTAAGHRAILSTCWYLSDFDMGADWRLFYPCDPRDFDGSEAQKALVVGGEACLWGEMVDATNAEARFWPRALAPAERLWSAATVNDSAAAVPRFEEHRCRMILRGFNAQPVNGPSFCPSDYLV